MKKYNKSQIMKNAWRTYKYVGKKQGKSFGECLASSWRLEKLAVSMAESQAKAKAQREAEAKANAEYRANNKAVKADYNGAISHEALYGRSFVSGGYCGD